MECMYLAPIPENGEYKPCSTIHWLGPDDDWTEAPELGMLAKVFQQDVRNLPYVQVRDVQGLDPVALVGADTVVITSDAVKKIEEWLA